MRFFRENGGNQPGEKIKSVSADQLPELLWPHENSNFAIIPFESLQQTWKVLMIDGQSPVHNDFDPAAYPLTVYFSCYGESCAKLNLPATNRDPKKLTVLVMTGVTALVRRTAWTMEQKGILYPGQDIRDWLRKADLTHISNEIPFAENCPYPNPDQQEIRFCSSPRYISLLEDLGADIIEMTGNHFQDWGSDATLMTLEMYDQRGWLHYGGGADLADSRRSIKLINNGNKIGFIGCDASGPYYAWATETEPGAAPCGDLGWMVDEVRKLRADGYLPIVTFQYYEYYTPEPRPNQSRDYKLVADAGAILVSGSQAHIPQAMEFHDDTLLLYGLGNLFFDQMNYPVGNSMTTRTRQELITRHVFYDNQLISTELLSAMLEDYARPRPMTSEERKEFLKLYFPGIGMGDGRGGR